MDFSDPPGVPRCRSSADEPDRIRAELAEDLARAHAKPHIRWWIANSAQGDLLFRPRLTSVAHEALVRDRQSPYRIAELLTIQAKSTLATRQGSFVQISYTATSSMNAVPR